MNQNIMMFMIAIVALAIGVRGGWGISYLIQEGKDPKALLDTTDTVIDGVKAANDTIGKALIPAPIELIIDKVLKTAQAGVHAAQQLCDSDQLTEDQRKQRAFDSAMNLLKLEGYQPTPELETAVKDAIETGVFVMKNIVKPSVETAVTDPVNVTVDTQEESDPVVSVDPIMPAEQAAPIAPAIQPILDAATQAGQAAYQQVVQDSIQALSVQQSA